MSRFANVRKVLETLRTIATSLNDDEISDIAAVLYRALKRLEKEAVE